MIAEATVVAHRLQDEDRTRLATHCEDPDRNVNFFGCYRAPPRALRMLLVGKQPLSIIRYGVLRLRGMAQHVFGTSYPHSRYRPTSPASTASSEPIAHPACLRFHQRFLIADTDYAGDAAVPGQTRQVRFVFERFVCLFFLQKMVDTAIALCSLRHLQGR